MNSSVKIFSIKTVSFEQGERDPFGFDDFSEKLGAEYLPFSGTVSKPSYFIFVAYLNHILNNKSIPWENEKERKEIQIKLEKLLVYCWKKNSSKEELRGAAILGNSFSLSDIDVFSGKGWVKQNAFKIYTDKNFAPKTLELYLKRIGEKQIPILNEFISRNYRDPNIKADYLKELLKRLKRKYSLFNKHRLDDDLKKQFKAELLEKIKGKRKNEYMQYIQPFFTYQTFNDNNFWAKLLENKKLPFASLNDWFGKFVLAVDGDIYNKPNKTLLWNNANDAFERIEPKFLSVAKAEIKLIEKQKPKIWFQLKEKTYSFKEVASKAKAKAEKNKIESQWESYKKRQGEEILKRYFFNFRHYALLRLLKELQQ